jgi:hypothetical protein
MPLTLGQGGDGAMTASLHSGDTLDPTDPMLTPTECPDRSCALYLISLPAIPLPIMAMEGRPSLTLD